MHKMLMICDEVLLVVVVVMIKVMISCSEIRSWCNTLSLRR